MSAASRAALEEFCLLAKTARGRACEELVKQVLSRPSIFLFGELLAMPNVQALKETDHAKWLHLLELFAYGTFQDYVRIQSEGPKLPDLLPAWERKLRMLSVLSLVKDSNEIHYSCLKSALGIESVRGIEDIVIEMVRKRLKIYAGLMSGRLDQRNETLRTWATMSRDVRIDEVGEMIATLSRWDSCIDSMIKTLDKQKRMVQKQKECRKPSMHTKDSTGQGGQAGYDQEVMSSEKDML